MRFNVNKQAMLAYLSALLLANVFASCHSFDDERCETDFYPTSKSGLSILELNTDNKTINSTDQWLKGAKYSMKDESGTIIQNGSLDIKGRGNSTWKMPKKPYSINLSESTEVYGMSAHKRWNLLANYADKTLLRTEVAFKLGYLFDHLSWTPHSVQLDLYINGKYRGVYQLTEAIAIDENRVNIEKISIENPNNGYILEADWRKGERYNFKTNRGIVFCCSDPDEELDKRILNDTISLFQKIRSDVQQVEDVLYSTNFKDSVFGYRRYLDIPSIIDWYFVNEITKNVDSQFGLSVYLFYDNAKQKYCMGPIWDYDYAIGNVNYTDCLYPTGFWVRNSYWISRLFEDPEFVQAVKLRWLEKRAETYSICSFIKDRAADLEKAQAFNFKKWRILDKQVASGAPIVGDYQMQVDSMTSWINKRLEWLDKELTTM